MHASSPVEARLAALRAEVRAIEQAGRAAAGGVLPFGLAEVDGRLAAGGLALAALHEATPATATLGDEAAATLFLAALAARLARAEAGGQVLWALSRRDLFAPGLARAGLSPDRVIYAECRDDREALAVMEDALRHGSLAAVVGEVASAGMACARRLQLAAEEGETTALLLRRWRKGDPLAPPSSAVTRWRIGCAPSVPLPFGALGRACWRVDLVRQRGGPAHHWILEAPDAEARLAVPARSGDRPDQALAAAAVAGRAAA
jgi:protein ImuA